MVALGGPVPLLGAEGAPGPGRQGEQEKAPTPQQQDQAGPHTAAQGPGVFVSQGWGLGRLRADSLQEGSHRMPEHLQAHQEQQACGERTGAVLRPLGTCPGLSVPLTHPIPCSLKQQPPHLMPTTAPY